MQNTDEKIKIKDFGKKFTEISLSSFIAAFLEGVSSSTIDKVISSGFDTLAKIKNADIKDLCKYAELKESVALIIKYGVLEHEKEMKEFIQSGTIKIIMPFRDAINLNGISFCFTGPLEIMSRNEAKEKIRMLGGVSVNTVNRNLTFLVTNDTESYSSKNLTAKEYNIAVINENEFYDIIENPEKANAYKKRGYKAVQESNYNILIRMALDDEFKPTLIDEPVDNHLSADNKSILSKYKEEDIDLDSIMEEQNTLQSIKKNIRENQIDCLHYCYISIANLYYKYRKIDPEFLLESLKYYLLDSELLQKYRDFMIEERKKTYNQFGSNLSEKSLEKEIERMKKEPIYGAHDTFKRLVIIYEKQGLHENALEICDKAIKLTKNNSYYNKKKASIMKKISDEGGKHLR
jgi:hypothetical protein